MSAGDAEVARALLINLPNLRGMQTPSSEWMPPDRSRKQHYLKTHWRLLCWLSFFLSGVLHSITPLQAEILGLKLHHLDSFVVHQAVELAVTLAQGVCTLRKSSSFPANAQPKALTQPLLLKMQTEMAFVVTVRAQKHSLMHTWVENVMPLTPFCCSYYSNQDNILVHI